MLAEALHAEVEAYIAAHAAERDANGRGWWSATAPPEPGGADQRGRGRGHGSAGQRQAHRRGNRGAAAVLLSDLAGLGAEDREDHRGAAAAVLARPVERGLRAALGQFLGSSAGLSAAVITKLTETWKAEQRAFAARDLSGVDYVYLWADGIHVNIRLEEHKLCLLVMIGVRADGRKELIAWRMATASRRSRGRTCCGTAPAGGCAPRCWPPATARWGSGTGCGRSSRRPGRAAAGSTRSLTCLPRCQVRAPRREEGARGDLERRGQAARPRRGEGVRGRLRREVPQGRREDHRRRGRAAGLLRLPRRALGAPAEDEPESTFATVRHRTKVTKGPGSRAAAWRWRSSSSSQRRTAGAPSTPRTSSPGPRRSDLHQRQTRERPARRRKSSKR